MLCELFEGVKCVGLKEFGYLGSDGDVYVQDFLVFSVWMFGPEDTFVFVQVFDMFYVEFAKSNIKLWLVFCNFTVFLWHCFTTEFLESLKQSLVHIFRPVEVSRNQQHVWLVILAAPYAFIPSLL